MSFKRYSLASDILIFHCVLFCFGVWLIEVRSSSMETKKRRRLPAIDELNNIIISSCVLSFNGALFCFWLPSSDNKLTFAVHILRMFLFNWMRTFFSSTFWFSKEKQLANNKLFGCELLFNLSEVNAVSPQSSCGRIKISAHDIQMRFSGEKWQCSDQLCWFTWNRFDAVGQKNK